MTFCVQMKGINKSFNNVQVLRNIDIEIKKGEVHALVGENGAGKSTLMRILAGVIQPDNGQILINGQKVSLLKPKDAIKAGISLVFQELSLFNNLSIMENLMFFLPTPKKYIKWKKLITCTEKILQKLELEVDPKKCVGELNLAEKQMIEIGKALISHSDIIILDEPTSSLAPNEIHKLFNIISQLKGDGKSIIFISHKLEEILEIADRITVLKDGEKIKTLDREKTTKNEIVTLMIGRKVEHFFPEIPKLGNKEIVFALNNFNTKRVKDVNLYLRKGEILGIGGLAGQGQEELLRSIFTGNYESGEIVLGKNKLQIRHPKDSLKIGLSYVPADRKEEGLNLNLSVKDNLLLPKISVEPEFKIYTNRQELSLVNNYIRELEIRAPSLYSPVSNLSGGNQQKVVVGKFLIKGNNKVFIMVEPTRGIDVGAKLGIYELMRALIKEGVGIIFYSQEMLELINLSHRISVMFEGKIIQTFDKDEATEELIMKSALGMDIKKGGIY